MKSKTITLAEFFEETKKLVQADPLWEELSGCLDYFIFSAFSDGAKMELTSIEFDVIATTTYGGSEGIYCGVRIIGDCGQGTDHRPVPFATFKTLQTDRDAFLKISVLGNLFCYYAMDFLSKNWKRFEK